MLKAMTANMLMLKLHTVISDFFIFIEYFADIKTLISLIYSAFIGISFTFYDLLVSACQSEKQETGDSSGGAVSHPLFQHFV